MEWLREQKAKSQILGGTLFSNILLPRNWGWLAKHRAGKEDSLIIISIKTECNVKVEYFLKGKTEFCYQKKVGLGSKSKGTHAKIPCFEACSL